MNKLRWNILGERSSVSFNDRFIDDAEINCDFREFDGVFLADKDFQNIEIILFIYAPSLHSAGRDQTELLKSPFYFDVGNHTFFQLNSYGLKQQPWKNQTSVILIIKNVQMIVLLETVKVEIIGPGQATVSLKADINRFKHELNFMEWHDTNSEINLNINLRLQARLN